MRRRIPEDSLFPSGYPAGTPEELIEVGSTYTRKQAIEDGVLVDLSSTQEAREAGFKAPVAATRHLWETIESGVGVAGQALKGRLWDVCFMAVQALKAFNEDKHLVPFEVLMKDPQSKLQKLELWLTFNEAEGFTIMHPEDY